MISLKFVKIAREVIEFIKRGNRLTYGSIVYDRYMSCPLGAVCFNHNYYIDSEYTKSIPNFYEGCATKYYDFARDLTQLDGDFPRGFDSFFEDSEIDYNNEDFMIGYKLAEMCYKRGWLRENNGSHLVK